MMDVGRNRNGRQLRQQWFYRAICIHELCNGGMQKRRDNFFLLFHVFEKNNSLFVLLLPELLQGLLITWL
jgi:hypothetical protein